MAVKRIHVVAAVIAGGNDRILIAKRPDHLHKGGLWEFPGGKLDWGEIPQQALVRELQEELAITATAFSPLTQIHYDYPEKSILLDVWTVTGFAGEPIGNEGQSIEWVSKARLRDYPFPEANMAVVDLILQS